MYALKFLGAAILGGALLASLSSQTAGAAPTVITSGDFRIEFTKPYQAKYAQFDTIVEQWMQANSIHAAQLAFRKNGKLLFSHAYTMGAGNPLVKITNVMRLASVSKMMATSAVTVLYRSGQLTPGLKVFPYLGISSPLFASQHPDPNIDQITVQELVDHTAGLHGSGVGDPLFMMRDIEVAMGSEPITKQQFARYVYGQPLLSTPGTQSVYSNIGYLILGMVVEKATGQSFFSYVNNQILLPLGLKNVSLAKSSFAARNRNEVIPDDSYTGPSIFDLSASPKYGRFNYEGGNILWEIADAPSDFMTNAESISKLIHSYNVYGLGGRMADYARSGCVPGVATWAESLSNNVDVALFFNARPCLDFPSSVIANLRNALAGL